MKEGNEDLEEKLDGEINNKSEFLMDGLEDISMGFVTEEEKEELFKWMMGLTSEPPEAVQKIANNLASKINIMMGYVITMNLKRIDHLSEFMQASEEYLFDVEYLINEDDPDRMLEYYKAAKDSLKDSLEWTRKYVYQNKKDIKEAGEKYNKIQSLLMSLPKKKLDLLIEFLEKGNIDEIDE